MKRPSVFAGMPLSGQLAGPVDQRLFAPARQLPESEVPVSSPNEPPKVTHWRDSVAALEAKPGESPPPPPKVPTPAKAPIPIESARIERPLMEPEAKVLAPFELNEKATHKVSFLFTDAEFDRLDDLKLELRRRFSLDAIKNDIVRVALQLVCEDYSKNPDRSALVTTLSKKAA